MYGTLDGGREGSGAVSERGKEGKRKDEQQQVKGKRSLGEKVVDVTKERKREAGRGCGTAEKKNVRG